MSSSLGQIQQLPQRYRKHRIIRLSFSLKLRQHRSSTGDCLLITTYPVLHHGFGIGTGLKNKLQIIQNKMVRFIIDLGPSQHIGQSELLSIGMFNTEDRVKQLSLNIVRNIFNDKCPQYLKAFFEKVSDVHCYNTRASSHNFYVPKVNTISAGTFYYNSIKEWNKLPEHIKSIQNKMSFKSAVKKHLGLVTLNREANL